MKIALDGTTLCDKQGGRGAGVEHYTWSILYSLLRIPSKNTYLLVVPEALSQADLAELIRGVSRVKVVRSKVPKVTFFSRHLLLPVKLYLMGTDVLFAPAAQVPWGWRGKSVLTIHDLAIYENPEWFPDIKQQDFAVNTIVPKSIQEANAFVAVSKATQQQLERLFPVARGKSRVVYEGVTLKKCKNNTELERFPYEKDYVFYLGTLEPRKNLVAAMNAFDRFLDNRPEQATQVRFILAGKLGWKWEEIEKTANTINDKWKQADPGGVVQALGHVSEEEKWCLLSRASAFIFPSLYEGFGLPVLEAMSVGVPVICSNKGALPEVGGDVVMYVEPDDIDKMALQIAQCILLPEGISIMRQEEQEQAKKFSWQKAAQETLEVIEGAGKYVA
jgi:glycosyltransferase involved in cell wall biosynthesis